MYAQADTLEIKGIKILCYFIDILSNCEETEDDASGSVMTSLKMTGHGQL